MFHLLVICLTVGSGSRIHVVPVKETCDFPTFLETLRDAPSSAGVWRRHRIRLFFSFNPISIHLNSVWTCRIVLRVERRGTATHFVLLDDAVRLQRFSPLERDLLLERASLDGLQRDGAGHCKHKTRTDQRPILIWRDTDEFWINVLLYSIQNEYVFKMHEKDNSSIQSNQGLFVDPWPRKISGEQTSSGLDCVFETRRFNGAHYLVK